MRQRPAEVLRSSEYVGGNSTEKPLMILLPVFSTKEWCMKDLLAENCCKILKDDVSMNMAHSFERTTDEVTLGIERYLVGMKEGWSLSTLVETKQYVSELEGSTNNQYLSYTYGNLLVVWFNQWLFGWQCHKEQHPPFLRQKQCKHVHPLWWSYSHQPIPGLNPFLFVKIYHHVYICIYWVWGVVKLMHAKNYVDRMVL